MIGPEFSTCILKIGRAEEHFNTFKAELAAWIEGKPYALRRDRNADGSRHALVVNIVNPAPLDRWSLIAGDCVHNLRSALDHMVYALAIQSTGINPPPRPRRLQFPIVKTPDEFEAQRYRITDLTISAQRLIERAQPYHGSYEPFPPALAILDEFDNSDKHRLINLAMSHVVGKIDLIPPIPAFRFIPYVLSTAIRDGAEVAFFTIDPPQPDVEYRHDFKVYITVAHIPGPSGNHVDALEGVLGRLVAEVKRIVNSAI